MKHCALMLSMVVLLATTPVFGQLEAPGGANTPEVGEMAPDFTLATDIFGETMMGMTDFEGSSRVLLAFYPADFTGG
jgi:hypothetical protein